MEVEINKDKEEFTDFYWLVQKSFIVYENEKEKCLGSGRRENCYFARRRKRISGTEFILGQSNMHRSLDFLADHLKVS